MIVYVARALKDGYNINYLLKRWQWLKYAT